jgi:hypothetical protein
MASKYSRRLHRTHLEIGHAGDTPESCGRSSSAHRFYALNGNWIRCCCAVATHNRHVRVVAKLNDVRTDSSTSIETILTHVPVRNLSTQWECADRATGIPRDLYLTAMIREIEKMRTWSNSLLSRRSCY